jgi:hypothetical protein
MRNPDGKPRPIDEAVAEWNELFAPLEAIGFHLMSFDPGVRFWCPDPKDGTVSIPVNALRTLNEALTKP